MGQDEDSDWDGVFGATQLAHPARRGVRLPAGTRLLQPRGECPGRQSPLHAAAAGGETGYGPDEGVTGAPAENTGTVESGGVAQGRGFHRTAGADLSGDS